MAAAAARPLLARPWVCFSIPQAWPRIPSWLSEKQRLYCQTLFGKGVQGYPVLMTETLREMRNSTPQVAFAGRSNVGKSTLLNSLIHRRPDPLQGQFLGERRKLKSPKAAPVSDKPGRTRHLFRFELGGEVTFVDLPGYGYAQVSKKVKEGWASLINDSRVHHGGEAT
ncbi:unnamed protein product [Prorocentrum cordatum]|uniref:EngB-type G domain-containing protein n=1 Tax=Prorocentrum cordatum TaxID=2364126 RepID=A0ABN9PCU4_9DINO|nr:unnamed protein product [Polarella glacialis]